MSTPPSKRQRLLLIIAGAGLLLLIFDRVLFTPLGRIWRAHAVEIVRLESSVANGRNMIARAEHTQQTWTAMRRGALPTDTAQAEQDLLAAFDRYGRANRIQLGSIKPRWKQGDDRHYSVLECRVEATGTLPAMARFLYDLESSPLALRVDSFNLTRRDNQGQKLALNLVVSGLRLAPLEGRR